MLTENRKQESFGSIYQGDSESLSVGIEGAWQSTSEKIIINPFLDGKLLSADDTAHFHIITGKIAEGFTVKPDEATGQIGTLRLKDIDGDIYPHPIKEPALEVMYDEVSREWIVAIPSKILQSMSTVFYGDDSSPPIGQPIDKYIKNITARVTINVEGTGIESSTLEIGVIKAGSTIQNYVLDTTPLGKDWVLDRDAIAKIKNGGLKFEGKLLLDGEIKEVVSGSSSYTLVLFLYNEAGERILTKRRDFSGNPPKWGLLLNAEDFPNNDPSILENEEKYKFELEVYGSKTTIATDTWSGSFQDDFMGISIAGVGDINIETVKEGKVTFSGRVWSKDDLEGIEIYISIGRQIHTVKLDDRQVWTLTLDKTKIEQLPQGEDLEVVAWFAAGIGKIIKSDPVHISVDLIAPELVANIDDAFPGGILSKALIEQLVASGEEFYVIRGTASEDASPERVDLYIDGERYGRDGIVHATGKWQIEIRVEELKELYDKTNDKGDLEFEFIIYDRTRNKTQVDKKITVDKSDAVELWASIEPFAGDDILTPDETITEKTLKGTTTVPAGEYLEVKLAGTDLSWNIKVGENGEWSVVVTPCQLQSLEPGDYKVVVSYAGKQINKEKTITVEAVKITVAPPFTQDGNLEPNEVIKAQLIAGKSNLAKGTMLRIKIGTYTNFFILEAPVVEDGNWSVLARSRQLKILKRGNNNIEFFYRDKSVGSEKLIVKPAEVKVFIDMCTIQDWGCQ